MKSATSKHPWQNVIFAILVMGTLTAGCAAHQPQSPGQKGYGQLAAEPPHQVLEQAKKAARPGPPPFVEHMAPLSKAVVQDDKLYSLAFENARLGEVITALTGPLEERRGLTLREMPDLAQFVGEVFGAG